VQGTAKPPSHAAHNATKTSILVEVGPNLGLAVLPSLTVGEPPFVVHACLPPRATGFIAVEGGQGRLRPKPSTR
jgi:hypothetical protein